MSCKHKFYRTNHKYLYSLSNLCLLRQNVVKKILNGFADQAKLLNMDSKHSDLKTILGKIEILTDAIGQDFLML